MGSDGRGVWRDFVDGLKRFGDDFGIGIKFILVIAGMGAIVAAVLIAYNVHEGRVSKNGPGDLRAANLTALEDGRPVIVLSSSVRHSRHGRTTSGTWNTSRLEVLAVDDGHSLSRVVVDKPLSCAGARPGLLWCDTNLTGGSSVELRDTATLAVRSSHAKVIAAAPPLPQEGHAQVEPSTGHAWLPTSDGRYWHVDPKTLTGETVDKAIEGLASLDGAPSPLAHNVTVVSVGNVYAEGEPRATLLVSDGREGVRPFSPDSWLHPEFVLETTLLGGTSGPLPVDGGKLILVAHHDSIEITKANTSITALALDGTRKWTTSLGHGEIVGAWSIDRRLVFAFHVPGKQGAIVALDATDGHVLWRTPI